MTARWLYRRRKMLFLILCASTFWIAYLYLSLPSPRGKEYQKNYKSFRDLGHVDLMDHGPDQGIHHALNKAISVTVRVNTPAKPAVKPAVKHDNLVLPPPPERSSNLSKAKVESVTKTKNGMFKSWMNIGVVGSHIRNKTWEMGAKMKNKSFEVAESVKNKTLAQLAVFGVGRKLNPTRFIFEPHRWNLTVSFEDIGNIMKDTEFLNKLHPLDFSSPVLASSQNRTANYTYNMPFHVGFCDCYEHYCVCCARISNKRLHLNTTTCTNFTFISKSHEIELQVLLDSKPIYKKVISADLTPMVCLGTYPLVVDICIHFFNMTFKVNIQHEHKTQLLGCTDFSLNLYNKTIGSFPVDCFQIPGDPNHRHKKGQINLFEFPNWMP